MRSASTRHRATAPARRCSAGSPARRWFSNEATMKSMSIQDPALLCAPVDHPEVLRLYRQHLSRGMYPASLRPTLRRPAQRPRSTTRRATRTRATALWRPTPVVPRCATFPSPTTTACLRGPLPLSPLLDTPSGHGRPRRLLKPRHTCAPARTPTPARRPRSARAAPVSPSRCRAVSSPRRRRH